MEGLAAAAGTALWLGVLTSISPCPLATNLAAVSFIGRRVEHPARVLLAGLMYTLGRVAAYAGLGALLVYGVLSIPGAAQFLQTAMNQLLGPVLLLAGLFLLDVLRLPGGGAGLAGGATRLADRWGEAAAAPLGILFALSFCPISAGLYFGSLLPLAAASGSPLLMPGLYGVGTGLPVVVFAILMAVSAHWAGRAFDRLPVISRWARRITGALFVVVGLYYCVTYLLGWL